MAGSTLWFLLGCVSLCLGSQGNVSRKCCRDYEVFDPQKQTCSFSQTHAYNSGFNQDAQYQPGTFPLKCPDGLLIADVSLDILSEVVTVPGSDRMLGYNEFCIVSEPREDKTTIAFCKLQMLNKCCPVGQVIHSSLRKCIPAQQTINFESAKRHDGKFFSVSHNASGWEYYLNYCVYQLDKYNEAVELGEVNTLIITENLYNRTQNISYYCLDALVGSESGNYSVVAMVGNPRKQQRYYNIIRIFFPKFCFGSSFFLLLTMIYYCAMPKLRRHLHGYSMICFLFSMMIVQLDIGIAFTIAGRTCVCAFIPYHRNFFRYASTAWTTAMGYMIWNQLLRNGQPQSLQGKKSRISTFGWYSLYAWGLSLVIVIASIIYDFYNPLTSACWWKSQHVKIFMDAPNIVLQLFNNIFFIPSAMHVWRSFRFVNQTVNSKDANSVVGKRKLAVVKMFAMMQSTKLAEILFSIRSLLNIQSDDYFMAVMCLYSLIGPLLFCVLVDIRSFINKQSIEQTRRKIQSAVLQHSHSVTSLFKQSESFNFDPSTDSTSDNLNVAPIKYLRKNNSVSGTFECSDASFNST